MDENKNVEGLERMLELKSSRVIERQLLKIHYKQLDTKTIVQYND